MKITWIHLLITGLVIFLLLGLFEYWFWNKSRQRIEGMSEKMELLEEAFQQNPQKADSLAIQKLALEIQKLEHKVEAYDDALRNDFFIITRFGIPATLIGLLGLFWAVYKTSLSFALDEAKKEREKQFKPVEQMLREEKKILILHHPKVAPADQADIQNHFNASKFWNVHHTNFSNEDGLKNVSWQEYDLIMFNNQSRKDSEHFTEEMVEEVLEKYYIRPDAVLFYYNGGNLEEFRADERFSSANFKSQIVPNILNLLKFQDLSKRSQ